MCRRSAFNSTLLGEQERGLNTPASYTAAFDKLLEECLAADAHNHFVVLYDESFSPYLEALTQVVVARDLPTAFIMVPAVQQHYLCERLHRLPDETRLSLPLEEAVSNADRVLNVLSGDTRTLPVRKAILDIVRSKECRFAHVPGISDEVLRLVECSPFRQILEHSELVAWALGGATDAILETYDSAGRRYTLTMDLGGWKNEPLMSPGLLLPGSWGNLPPGETFCCPDPAKVDGQVCISGSVPRYVLQPNDEVVLTFERGRLIDWRSERDSPALRFFDQERARAAGSGDSGWSLFAELGVGLNPAIMALTGNPLYDEKVAGTVHVAIGDNRNFGHDNSSSLHADLAILRPTLKLPTVEIMSGGELAIHQMEAARRAWRPQRIERDPAARVALKAAEVIERDGRLLRRLCKAGRVGYVRMGADEVGYALACLVRQLADIEETSIAALRDALPTTAAAALDEHLDILQHFECVEVG